MNNDLQFAQTLRKLKPLLADKFHVDAIGYFGKINLHYTFPKDKVNLLVRFSEPVGWEFFELEEFLEFKLKMPVDITTENGIAPSLREKVISEVVMV
jgi:uncharacterized protein